MARVATGFGSSPFHKLDSVYSVTLKDTFVTASALSAITTSGVLTSDLNWTVTDVVGAATADVEVLPGEANHPGIVRLNVGASTPADGDVVSMALSNADAVALDGNGVYVAAVLRIPDVDATKVFFGLAEGAAAVNSADDNLCGFVWDPEDAANVDDKLWLVQVNDAAGGDTEVVLDKVPYVEDDWVLLEMVANSTDTTFRITTADNEQTVQIGGVQPATTLTPMFIVENVGAAEEAIEIDTFVLRYVLPNDIAEYLGA